jgi:hypothetical protein
MARIPSQPSWSPYELQPGMELPRLSEIVRRLELACPSEDVFQINQRTQRLLERLNPGDPRLISEATNPRTPALSPYSFEMLLNPYVPDPHYRPRTRTEPIVTKSSRPSSGMSQVAIAPRRSSSDKASPPARNASPPPERSSPPIDIPSIRKVPEIAPAKQWREIRPSHRPPSSPPLDNRSCHLSQGQERYILTLLPS